MTNILFASWCREIAASDRGPQPALFAHCRGMNPAGSLVSSLANPAMRRSAIPPRSLPLPAPCRSRPRASTILGGSCRGSLDRLYVKHRFLRPDDMKRVWRLQDWLQVKRIRPENLILQVNTFAAAQIVGKTVRHMPGVLLPRPHD